MNPPPNSGVSDDSNVQKLLIVIRFSGFHGRVARNAHAQSVVIQFPVIPFERSRWRGGRQACYTPRVMLQRGVMNDFICFPLITVLSTAPQSTLPPPQPWREARFR
jgi:hypothetical protein